MTDNIIQEKVQRILDDMGPVRLVQGPVHHPAGHTAGHHGSHSLPARHQHHAECDVADGCGDDDRDRGFELDFDCRVHPLLAQGRHAG